MKRLWFGVGLLILLLLLGAAITVYVGQLQARISSQLLRAADAAQAGLWEDTALYCSRAETLWEQQRHMIASIADHEPMEEVDSLFSQLEILLQARDPVAFSLTCSSLEVFVRAIGEAHSISWWSIL